MSSACFLSDARPLSPAETGTIRIDIFPHHLCVTGHGLWSAADVDRHFGALEQAAGAMRATRGGARILVDLRRAAVQPADTATRVQYWTGRIYQECDRLAVLLDSSLLKAQMRRVAVAAHRELFLSESAARTWLLA